MTPGLVVEDHGNGGYTVTAGRRWFNVLFNGVDVNIVSDDNEVIDRGSLLGRTILKSVKEHLADG